MPELAPGGQLGAYRIISVIGRGGMGVVYLAEDTGLERHVAVKVLAPQFSADSSFRSRFERKSRLAASLDHPNVVPVYEAGEIDGVLFIAMRYVDGPDLRTVLDREGRFDVGRAIGISAQLASALDAAHAHGLIHRDVKPGNVLLAAGYGSDGGEHVYLSDFGLTKRSASKSGLTQLGQLVGTIDYIAPEQITGTGVDGRVDIYALGCVFFEMLAGSAPFERETDLATMAAHLHEPPPSLVALRPDLPPAADPLIAHVLAKDPDQRFSTAAEFVRAARVALLAKSRPTAGDVSGRASPTVVVPPPTAAQESVRSPTVLGDTSVPLAAAAAATVAAAATPDAAAGPAAAAGAVTPAPQVAPIPEPLPLSGPPPIPASAPNTAQPPATGPFATGGSAPPYLPTGSQGEPQPGRSGPSLRMAVIAVAVFLGLALVAGVSLAIVGAPQATPTLVAQASPTVPTVSAAPTSIVTPTATPSATLVPTVTEFPPTSPPSVSPSPNATPTPSVAPTATPHASSTPVSGYLRLIALLSPSLNPTTNCSESSETVWRGTGSQVVGQAVCSTSGVTRYYALFANPADLDAVWTDILGNSSGNVCNGSDAAHSFPLKEWSYNATSTVTEGRVACFRQGNGTPQLNFTYQKIGLFGILVAEGNTTARGLTDTFANDNGVVPQ